MSGCPICGDDDPAGTTLEDGRAGLRCTRCGNEWAERDRRV